MAIAGDFTGRTVDDLEIVGCRLTGSKFTGAELHQARICDTVFERCDLSACALAHSVLARVAFDDCRLSGLDLSAARLQDVSFHECRLDEATFRMASGTRVRFEGCDLTTADLYAAQLPGAWFFDCTLTGAELSQANLTGARLHGSTFGSLRGAAALRGTTISSAQVTPVALQVLAALAITIDDGREPPQR